MRLLRKILTPLVDNHQNENFLIFVDKVEDFYAKLLSLAMIAVVLFAILDLGVVLVKEIFQPLSGFSGTLLKIFGLFLNILIAL